MQNATPGFRQQEGNRLSFSGTFWLGSTHPLIYIEDDIIHIGCKEITIEAVKALAKHVEEYERPNPRYRRIQ